MATETASVLFADIVGSTQIRQRLGEERADRWRRTHDQLMADAVVSAGGRVVKSLGDGVMALFGSAAEAVDAGVAMQRAADLHGRTKPDEAFELRVGLSVGDVSVEDDDIHGTAVVEAARLCDTAQGGQILAADLVRALTRGRGSHIFESVGSLELKGLDNPVAACWVSWEPVADSADAQVPFPPLLRPNNSAAYAGRVGLLAGLHKSWDLVDGGQGSRTILLAGEPGVGKTRTASELGRRIHVAGGLVLYGRCDEELALPYEPFVEALDFQTANDPSLPLGRFAGDLRKLVPDLERRVPGLPPGIRSDPRAEEHRLFEATADWLTSVSADAGLLLVVDDLHWATKPTLQLLLHVASAAAADPEARLLIVATYRDTDVDRAHPLFGVLADLRRVRDLERISIDPLTEGEVLDLIADVAGHELDDSIRQVARRAHAETEGNPYFVGEVLRHFVETGAVRFEDGRWIIDDPEHVDVPEGVRDVIGRRLNRLSELANEVLTAAAVIGRDFNLDVVSTVLDHDVDEVLDVLDEAVRARLIDETGAGEFRFAHALTRQALYEELSATRQRRQHRKVVEALERLRPNDLAGLAHHSIEAGPVGGDLSGAIGYSIAAGEAALEARAIDDADRHFRAALELLEDTDDPPLADRLRVELGRGQVQRDTGDPAYQQTFQRVTKDALAAGLTDIAVASAHQNSRGIESMIGQLNVERIEQLESVIEAFDGDARDRALLLGSLAAEWSLEPGTADKRLAMIDEARALALQTEDPHLIAQVFLVTGNSANVPDRLGELAEFTDVLLTNADLSGDPTLRIWARMQAGFTSQLLGRPNDARSHHAEGLAIAQDEGNPRMRWVANNFHGQYAAWDGDVASSVAAAEETLAVGTELGEPDALNWYGGARLGLAFQTGEVREMAPLLDQLAADWSAVEYSTFASFALIEAGDLDEARRRVEAERLTDPRITSPNMFNLGVWTSQAWQALLLGRRDDAARLVEYLEPHVGRWGSIGVAEYPPVAIGLACAHATLGHHELAGRFALEAWEEVRDSPVRVLIPVTAKQSADVLRRVGSPDARARAREIVDWGLQEAEAMSMPHLASDLAQMAAELDGSAGR